MRFNATVCAYQNVLVDNAIPTGYKVSPAFPTQTITNKYTQLIKISISHAITVPPHSTLHHFAPQVTLKGFKYTDDAILVFPYYDDTYN